MESSVVASQSRLTVLLVENSGSMVESLRSSLANWLSVAPIIVHDDWSEGQLRDELMGRIRWDKGRSSLLSAEGTLINAIGINTNLALSSRTGHEKRAHNHGIQLVEWFRRDLQLTIPIVLWSFLSLNALKGIGREILRYEKGLVFVPLPASLAEFRGAFERALSPKDALSQDELDKVLISLAGEERLSADPLDTIDPALQREAKATLASLGDAYKESSQPLMDAVEALAKGNAQPLSDLLVSARWLNFVAIARDLRKSLGRVGIDVTEVSELSYQANSIGSFQDWWKSNSSASASALAEAADYYRNCAMILHDSFRALTG